MLFFYKSETTFSKQFSPKLFFFYLKLNTVQKHVQIACEIALRNYLPPLRSSFQKYCYSKHTLPSSEMVDLPQRWYLKGINEKNQGYL